MVKFCVKKTTLDPEFETKEESPTYYPAGRLAQREAKSSKDDLKFVNVFMTSMYKDGEVGEEQIFIGYFADYRFNSDKWKNENKEWRDKYAIINEVDNLAKEENLVKEDNLAKEENLAKEFISSIYPKSYKNMLQGLNNDVSIMAALRTKLPENENYFATITKRLSCQLTDTSARIVLDHNPFSFFYGLDKYSYFRQPLFLLYVIYAMSQHVIALGKYAQLMHNDVSKHNVYFKNAFHPILGGFYDASLMPDISPTQEGNPTIHMNVAEQYPRAFLVPGTNPIFHDARSVIKSIYLIFKDISLNYSDEDIKIISVTDGDLIQIIDGCKATVNKDEMDENQLKIYNQNLIFCTFFAGSTESSESSQPDVSYEIMKNAAGDYSNNNFENDISEIIKNALNNYSKVAEIRNKFTDTVVDNESDEGFEGMNKNYAGGVDVATKFLRKKEAWTIEEFRYLLHFWQLAKTNPILEGFMKAYDKKLHEKDEGTKKLPVYTNIRHLRRIIV